MTACGLQWSIWSPPPNIPTTTEVPKQKSDMHTEDPFHVLFDIQQEQQCAFISLCELWNSPDMLTVQDHPFFESGICNSWPCLHTYDATKPPIEISSDLTKTLISVQQSELPISEKMGILENLKSAAYDSCKKLTQDVELSSLENYLYTNVRIIKIYPELPSEIQKV